MTATRFDLRDYLRPGGKYPYSDLLKHIQEAFNNGQEVYLYSVAGHFMLAGHPSMESSRKWSDGDLWYKTAEDALNHNYKRGVK